MGYNLNYCIVQLKKERWRKIKGITCNMVRYRGCENRNIDNMSRAEDIHLIKVKRYQSKVINTYFKNF